MQWQLLFLSVVPLLAFALVESAGKRRNAIVAAVLVAGVEFVFNSYRLGFVEVFSLVSLVVFVVLGRLSLQRNDSVFFKFQPVVLGLVLASVFWIHDAVADERLLALILEKHVRVNEVVPPYQRGYFAGYARTTSRSLPFLLVLHAALTAYAALRLSTWWWFAVRAVGFYLLVALLFFTERLLQASY